MHIIPFDFQCLGCRLSSDCQKGQPCDIETAFCMNHSCLPIMSRHTNVNQNTFDDQKGSESDQTNFNQIQLRLSCPLGNVLYDAGEVQAYKGISDGDDVRNTTLSCDKHSANYYWKTRQGGKLFYPSCQPMPGCDCLKGEM